MPNAAILDLSNLNTLLSLQVLKKLGDGLNFDFTALENLIVDNAQDTQTSLTALNAKIEELKSLVLQQNQQPIGGLTFTPLTLQPTYSQSTNWSGERPANLGAITDGDSNSSTNGFWIGGIFYQRVELILSPGITIPQYTRINLRIGLLINGGSRGYFEFSTENLSGAQSPIWAKTGIYSNTTETIVNIDRIIPYQWNKLIFALEDVGAGEPKMKIYDLKVWEVS